MLNMQFKIGDRVKGTYNNWLDHPDNYMIEIDYVGKIHHLSDNECLVELNCGSLINVDTNDGDTIKLTLKQKIINWFDEIF